MDNTQLNFYYHEAVQIWEDLCKLHGELFELTCDEYMTLLSSDLDQLETLLPIKDDLIAKVALVDQRRNELIKDLNKMNPDNKISRAGELLGLMSEIDLQLPIPALSKLNALLIDTIYKIQAQNKKNQLFLNKAIINIQELKSEFKGNKTHTTYGRNGFASKAAVR